MVILNKIYTRTGDDGTTALGSGKRLPKHHPRIAAFGAVDETNAAIGVARLELEDAHAQIDLMLERIQNDLFDLGADLCVPENGERAEGALRIIASQVKRLEAEIDELNAALQPLRSFVLPGGTRAAAALHVARTVCRRAERGMAQLAVMKDETVGEAALHYINRLSDLLFVASRYVNDKGKTDRLWTPGENR
ncbi:MAG: cob(I)yrinic acid a,c-diamide adenosyltransferase [Proteobacteria bacterium]|nr:cob(I)yrinic acid a,c-diamide adenosyltransferase [Pseudomonadota bacterium]